MIPIISTISAIFSTLSAIVSTLSAIMSTLSAIYQYPQTSAEPFVSPMVTH